MSTIFTKFLSITPLTIPVLVTIINLPPLSILFMYNIKKFYENYKFFISMILQYII
uniref:Uncharacterized protein n=1 Tax=Clostridium perfringens TaxID=1502 RepID=G5DSD6_CLOPF|nr:hypothetical protein pMini_004 [Clostridium perfringens]